MIDDISYELEGNGYDVTDEGGNTLFVSVLDTVSPGPGGIYNMMPNENMLDDIYETASMYAAVNVFIDRGARGVVVEVLR